MVVFQKHALFPWFTAFENVAYGLHRRKLPAKDRQTRVEYALTELGYSLKPILDAMWTWGENYKQNQA